LCEFTVRGPRVQDGKRGRERASRRGASPKFAELRPFHGAGDALGCPSAELNNVALASPRTPAGRALAGGWPGRRYGCRGPTRGWSGGGGARGLVVALQKVRSTRRCWLPSRETRRGRSALWRRISLTAPRLNRGDLRARARGLRPNLLRAFTEVALRKRIRFGYNSDVIVV
jgi:hypothetical protein